MTGYKIIEALFLLDAIDYLVPQVAQTRKPTAESINLNRTRTTQEARKIEDKLARDLARIFRTIMADPSKDIGLLQRKYGKQVQDVIRGATQRIYLIGSDYALKTQDTTAFITQRDLDNIRRQTAETVATFWRRITAQIRGEITTVPEFPEARLAVRFNKPIATDVVAVDIDSMAESVATLMTSTTLSSSMLSKLQQIGAKPTVTWVTEQDAKVCPDCQALQGREWELDPFTVFDSDIPQPGPDSQGGSTHWNCRCRLMVKQGGEILSG